MPVTNPFEGIGIGASRDPSLTQRLTDTNKLRGALQQIAATGKWDELTANIDAASREKVANTQRGSAYDTSMIGANIDPRASPQDRAAALQASRIASDIQTLGGGLLSSAQAGQPFRAVPAEGQPFATTEDYLGRGSAAPGTNISMAPATPLTVQGNLALPRQVGTMERTEVSQDSFVFDPRTGGFKPQTEKTVTETREKEDKPASTAPAVTETTVPEVGSKVSLVVDQTTAEAVFNIPRVQQLLAEGGAEIREAKVWEDASNYYVNFNGTGWIEIPKGKRSGGN